MVIKRIPVRDLKPGMICANNTYNTLDQLVVPKDCVLNEQIIDRLLTYGILELAVKIPELEPAVTVFNSEIVKKTPEFKQFKNNYSEATDRFKSFLNSFVDADSNPDISELLHSTYEVMKQTRNSLHFFDIMNNMHDVNDSIYRHSMNVSMLCMTFAKWLGYDKNQIGVLSVCGALHDIGMLLIDPDIVNKPGELTPSEYAIVQTHTTLGYKLLKSKGFDEAVARCALNHHERCDGSGYPSRLETNDIDDFSKIVAIADIYDAMTSKRSYREPLSPFDVVDVLESEGRNKYDQKLVCEFLERFSKTYSANTVLLSNGSTAKVVLMNSNWLSRPVVQTNEGDFIDLAKSTNLKIISLV